MSAFLAVDFDYKKGLLIHMDLFRMDLILATLTQALQEAQYHKVYCFLLWLPHNANYFCKYMLCVCVSIRVCDVCGETKQTELSLVPLGLSLFFIILTSIQN